MTPIKEKPLIIKEVNDLISAIHYFNEKLILDGFEPLIGCTNYESFSVGDVLEASWIKNGELQTYRCKIIPNDNKRTTGIRQESTR